MLVRDFLMMITSCQPFYFYCYISRHQLLWLISNVIVLTYPVMWSACLHAQGDFMALHIHLTHSVLGNENVYLELSEPLIFLFCLDELEQFQCKALQTKH